MKIITTSCRESPRGSESLWYISFQVFVHFVDSAFVFCDHQDLCYNSQPLEISTSLLDLTMPTNQSSPWGGGKLLTCSSTDHPTNEIAVSTQAKTVRTTKVPYSYISLEPSRKNDQAKSLMSSVVASPHPSLSQLSVATPVVDVWEKGDDTFTAVLDETLSSNKVLVPGLKGFGCTMLKYTSLETSQPEKISAVVNHQAATGVAPMELETTCHQDLLIIGRQAPQHTNKLTVSVNLFQH